MDGIVVFAIGFVALIFFISSLWYLIQTVRIMWAYNTWLAIASIFFSPIIHIAFYLIPKTDFKKHEKALFRKYFVSLALVAVLGAFAAIAIPYFEQIGSEAMVKKTDTSQPWDWDIRAEDQEDVQMSFAPEVDPNNEESAKLHFEAIYQAHPDADKIMESPEFKIWWQGKTSVEQDDISRILREGTASEVIYTFTVFKKDLQDYRDYEYQARRNNAQALAQKEYQEKRVRDLKANIINNQNSLERQQTSGQPTSQYSVQQEPAQRNLSYSERQERERLKATLSTPMKGANGELTRSQREALVALETGQPMPSHSQGAGGSISSSTPTPANITNCDGSGCWDTNGTRYNKGAGDTYFPSTGGVCQNVGGQMRCN